MPRQTPGGAPVHDERNNKCGPTNLFLGPLPTNVIFAYEGVIVISDPYMAVAAPIITPTSPADEYRPMNKFMG